jgi:signal peptidase I
VTPDAKSKKKKPEQPRRPWRDNIEAITMAIVMAVMLKYFVIEAYKIPTGSMQPTLMGFDYVEEGRSFLDGVLGRPRGPRTKGVHDRILVDKLSYHFRDPERFEVVVFKYPLDRSKNFIKRICGMPGEELKVENGDLWTRPDSASEWTILRRPDTVMSDIWKPLIDGDGTPDWKPVSGEAASWEIDARDIRARGAGQVQYPRQSGTILDHYTDGYPGHLGSKVLRGKAAANSVGDLRVTGEVRALEGCQRVTIELREGSRRYQLHVPGPAAGADATIRLEISEPSAGGSGDRVVDGPAYRLAAGRTVAFAAENLDDRIRLQLDGETLLTEEIDPVDRSSLSAVLLAIQGEGADFEDLMVARDIFYTQGGGRSSWQIPEGHYVMLGDNTQDSSDSREWTFKRFRMPPDYIAEAYGDPDADPVLRANYRLNENPIVVPGEQGSLRFLRDEWGELHTVPKTLGEPLPDELASYVPRELIIGRAVLVFWPFKPGLGVYRLKWIR